MEISSRINQANGRLKLGKIRLKIEKAGHRLCLRGTLPPKPGSTQTKNHQQRLYLGLPANPNGISEAEKLARKISALLDCKEFDWQDWLKPDQQDSNTVGYWIERLETDYFTTKARTLTTQKTFNHDYKERLLKLSQDAVLTSDLLKSHALKIPPDSHARLKFCMAATALAKVAGLDVDLKAYRGNYSAAKVKHRDVPDDDLIQRVFFQITNPQWRWVYAVIATYGLRPHEAFRLIEFLGVIAQVGGNTKTGYRKVWPCYPEWFDLFDCGNVNPPAVNLERENSVIGASVSRWFARAGIPFLPYDLRHAWAIRTLEFGLDITLAAQQMGHSVQIHSTTYHQWISDRTHQRAYETLMLRPDRPRPPHA
ncbi:site-specific integrase [Candidatus Synechococcus calcipolaris G9]|uniref:Site-specific integrase n=1 Tax=Candidatus Synechococcus calcipolaris G9 TaxID=1497997 RepID=A0ABT6EXN7_9SYNE|nr:site-specific integrase [Candidatus Synechococcus calcipolaris]MDG2990551.1 site-specific integrase [Candidatus Synechococcus calcipolaris G9]